MRRLIYFLACLSLLFGCSKAPPPPLRLTVNPWIGYDPFVLAREQGKLPTGLKLVEVSSNSESQRAFANGQAEAAALTLDEALRLAESGIALRIVAILDVSHGADALVARPEIEQLDQLAGKRIGVETGAVGALLLSRVLAAAQLTPEQIAIVPTEFSHQLQMMADGRLDAVVTFEPVRTQLLRRGHRVLLDSRTIPDQIIDVLVVRPDVDATPLLAAWREGLLLLEQDRQGAARLLARGVELSAEDYQAALDGLRFISPAESAQWLAGGETSLLVSKAQPIVAELMKNGLLARPPDWRALLGPREARR